MNLLFLDKEIDASIAIGTTTLPSSAVVSRLLLAR
jgi:hypothetical protein